METSKLGYSSLRDILEDNELLEVFKAFLNKLHTSENLSFWLDVEAFKKEKDTNLEKRAKVIYEKYIGPQSYDALNIDYSLKEEFLHNLMSGNVKSTIFDEMQDAIYLMLDLDGYRKFLQSEEHRKLMGM